MNSRTVGNAFHSISAAMTEHRMELVALDQKFGDGDLGISMDDGFRAVASYMDTETQADLGRVFMKCSSQLNGAAPSSLGTILSFGLMGMAKSLKGKTEANLSECADAMRNGLELIMQKAGSKPGEKTILDALTPAVESLEQNAGLAWAQAFEKAAQAAKAGAESTRAMRSVHGRAAYYADRSVGEIDGGSVVGQYLFEAIAKSIAESKDESSS